jgi:dipeptidyl aminopeptidase/acylaminoacyl peptidase
LSPVPLVLDVHGGPWLRNVLAFNSKHQWLAGQGYAALSVNFRGSSGFGNAFMSAADKQWTRAMHNDLLDAVNWAIGNGITTKDKVAIYGLSYGGYSALVSLTFTPDVFACAVSIAGPSDLGSLISNMPRWWTYQRPQFALRVGEPDNPSEAADLLAASPISRVDQVTKPLLVAQGLNDPRIYPWQSSNIVDALVKRKMPVTYLTYPDEGHEFEKTRTTLSFHAVAEHFLSACLGGKAQPFGTDLADSKMTVVTGATFIPGLEKAISSHPGQK